MYGSGTHKDASKTAHTRLGDGTSEEYILESSPHPGDGKPAGDIVRTTDYSVAYGGEHRPINEDAYLPDERVYAEYKQWKGV